MAISVKDSGSGKRRKGTFNLPGNFEVKIEGPLDTRMVVGSITDLLDTVNIDGEPKYQYYGMLVVVSGDETPENDGLYKLIEGGDPTVIDGWEKLLSGNSNDLLPDTIFSAHTGDTSIHFTKEEISLSEIGDSAHTHTLSEITDFDNYSGSVVTQIGTKLDSSDFISHTGDTNNPHKTSFSNLTSTAHTHSISDITNLQSELNDKLDTSDFDVYTGSVKDVHVTSGIVDAQNQTIKLTKSYGGDIDILNSGALFTDTNSYVTGGTYNETTGVVTYETSSGHTFDISGFTTGITDTFVESGTLDGTTLKLTKSDGNPVNDIDLTGLKGDKGEKGDTGFVQSGMFKWDGQNTGLALQTGEFSWSGEAVYDGITSLTFHKEDADGVDQSTFLDQYLNAKSGQIKTILDAHNGHNNVFQIIGASIDGNGHYKFDVYNVSLDEIEVNGGECEVYFVLVGAEGPKGEDGTSINIIEPTPNAGELAVFKSDTKIEGDSDLTWLDSTLNISGDIIANSLTTVWQNPTNTTRDNIRILHPEGGSYSDEGEGDTAPAGSIIITLPQGKIKSDSSTTGTYSMVSMSVKIYENGTNEHVLLNLAGWLHKDMVNNWYKCSAWVDSNPQYDSNFTVRFGYDRFLDKNVIIIGEPDRTWDWPDINIIDVQVGHYGQTPELWNNGWSIEIKNSWETEPHIISGTRYNVNTSGTGNDLVVFSSTQANNWSRSGSDLSYDRGNVGIGTSSPSQKLEVDGVTKSDAFALYNTHHTRIISPEGAEFKNTNNNDLGRIKITAPQTISAGGPATQFKATIKVFDDSLSFDVHVSCYIQNETQMHWHYAWIDSPPDGNNKYNFNVRFYYDINNKFTISIGEDTDTWRFLKVVVTDVILGVSNRDINDWATGWSIELDTKETIDTNQKYAIKTISATQANNWGKAGNSLKYDGGNVNISNGTLVIKDYKFPTSKGTVGQLLKLNDANGNLGWINASELQTQSIWEENTDDSIIYNKGTVNIGVRSISEDKLKLFVTRDDIGGINTGINDIPEIGITGSTHTALGYGSSTTNSYGIAMGTLQSSGRSWIQSKRFRWSEGEPNQTYDLLLNPLGGHVGIGTTNAESALHIKGSDYNNSSIRLLNGAHDNTNYWMIGSRSFGGDIDGFEIGRNTESAGGKFYITQDGNVSIGNGYQPTEKLEVNGNIIADSLSTEWSTGRHGNTRILSPGGGSFSADDVKLGAFIITLPQGGKNTMVSMTVKIYDHSKNEHITLNLAGYATAIYGQYTSAWKYPSAWIEGNPKDNHNFTVRFTYDLEEGKNVIIIGEKNSTWDFPDINIVDVQVGYDNSTPDKWNDGWKVELSTDWDIATYDDGGEDKIRYVEPNQDHAVIENTQAHNWIRNVNDVEYGNGNVNITNNKTLKINNYTLPAADGEADQVLKTDGDGSVTWQDDTDTNTSIWSEAGDTATYGGHIVVDSLSTNWQNTIYSARSNTRVLNPKGGSFSNEINTTGGVNSDGSIIITLPQGKSSTMISMTIKIYDYLTNGHLILNVSGFLFDGASHGWNNGSVWIDNNPKYSHNLTVWLGYDAELGKNVIIIGEPDTTWGTYLDVNVMDVQAQHHNEEVGKWNDGWDIELSTDWDTKMYGGTQWSVGNKKYITTNNTNTNGGNTASKFIHTQANNWYRSDHDTVEYDDGAIAKSFITKGQYDKRIISPEGATYYTNDTVSGSFIIELPFDDTWTTDEPWTNTHISLTAKIYDYSPDEHVTLNISGYNFKTTDNTNGGQWARTSAWIEGNPEDEHNFTVRFAYEKGTSGPGGSNGKCVIIIGEKNSTWDRPKLYVTDLQVAGSAYNQPWHKGWNVELSDDWDEQTIPVFPVPEYGDGTELKYSTSATIENTQAHNWARNGDNIEYNHGGTVKINDYTLPASDGTDGQVLKTDGSGNTSWGSASGRRNVKKVSVGEMGSVYESTHEYPYPKRYWRPANGSTTYDCRQIEPGDIILIDTGMVGDVFQNFLSVEVNLPPIYSSQGCESVEFQSGDIVTIKNIGLYNGSIGIATMDTNIKIDGETTKGTDESKTSAQQTERKYNRIKPKCSVTYMYNIDGSTKEWFIIDSHSDVDEFTKVYSYNNDSLPDMFIDRSGEA